MTQDQLPPLPAALQRTSSYYAGGGGYSTPPGSPGSSWASAIQGSRPVPSATPSVASDDPLMAPIFIGVTQGREYQGSLLVETGKVDKTQTLDSLLREFEKMERKQQRQLALLLTIGGYAGSVSLEDAAEASMDLTYDEVLGAYNELLMDAAGRYARGQKVTPEGILEQAVAFRLPKNAEWDGSLGGLRGILQDNDIPVPNEVGEEAVEEKEDLSGTFTQTSTNTTVNRDVMDPNDAMALTRAMLQRELGRDPTKGEFEDFIGAVQAAQRANPTRTTTKTKNTITKDEDGLPVDSRTRTTSSTQSGISQAGIEDILLRRARQNPDWAEWQAVGTYAPALFQALGATVPGV